MTKQIAFDKQAMEQMVKGLDIAAEAVGGTIGPKGRNVYLDDAMLPTITNDGATIADKIVLKDKLQNAGAYVIRNVSSQQNDDVGDGTTTVTVLTQAIIHECLKRPENPMVIKQSLKEAADKLLKRLAKSATPLKKEDIEKVALISSEDKHIAKLITEIINKLGKDAIINVEDSKTFNTDYEITDGYDAHVGFLSPYFINDKKAGRAVFNDVPVLVSSTKIANLSQISPIFDIFKAEGISQCVIVCEDIDDAILGILVNSKNMGTYSSVVIRASDWLLQDIERTTGATTISKSNGLDFKNFKSEHLGYAKKVVSDANKTLFITDGVSARKFIPTLEAQLENEQNQYTARNLKQRIAKLKGGLAVLRIGASTDFERDYLRRKAEDSVKATQAALAEGYVEGGGMALWRLAQGLAGKTIGEQILNRALRAPFKRIVENAGKDYAEIVAGLQPNMGYNARDDKYEKLIDKGIIDPVKVERCALENAVSAAGTFITTFALITDEPEDKKDGN
jgi:chaperonin GroEL